MYEIAKNLINEQNFTAHLGVEIINCQLNQALLKLPYESFLGEERINGGAIASLIDLAATCAIWCHRSVTPKARGATIGLNINFMKLVRKSDIFALSTVKKRGSNISVAAVEVGSQNKENIAFATVTYKLNV